jgi:hypothetical protein
VDGSRSYAKWFIEFCAGLFVAKYWVQHLRRPTEVLPTVVGAKHAAVAQASPQLVESTGRAPISVVTVPESGFYRPRIPRVGRGG